jgi:GH15 family glucan-1,4-alpha-glucosidase
MAGASDGPNGMSMTNLNLAPIGNCHVSALIDRFGRYVWACLPRPDGDPVFCSLLGGDRASEEAAGFWDIHLEGLVDHEQTYLRNTAVLRTVLRDGSGGAVEIIDFCPRSELRGRSYRPGAFARIVRPLSGNPRVRVRLRPAINWGAGRAETTFGSNHIRYVGGPLTVRLTTNATISYLLRERDFRLERTLYFFLGPDETFAEPLESLDALCELTVRDWRQWVRGLALPLEWQDAVIRAAIGLKLCFFEDTGAILAALTTSIPEAAHSGRNWDYRYCWLRDAYYVVQALNRLGAVDVLEGYLAYLRNLGDASGGELQPVYGLSLEAELEESVARHLPGYRGMGPVRIGNAAYTQKQHDVFGQVVLSTAQAFFDQRLLRQPSPKDFDIFEAWGQRAFELYDKPDAGLWELRGSAAIHTYSALMCWAACDRIAKAADRLGRSDRGPLWRARADMIARRIETEAWNADLESFVSTFGGAQLDASLLQLLDLRFIAADDPRFANTLRAVEHALVRNGQAMRYAHADDFGAPENAFSIATFWYIEALARVGRTGEARALFEHMLSLRTDAGLLSEDVDRTTGELWGNYPQTYSLVGIVNCAVMLSEPWSSLR